MRKGIGASADRGAYRDTDWIDHAARTYDRAQEPSFVHFRTVINQVPSSTATSAWSKLIGGPDSQSISISGGTFDYTDAVNKAGVATGTITSGQTSATLPRGTWIRCNVATSASGSTTTSATLTVRGTYTFTFSAITATASNYYRVDNGGAVWSQATTLPSFSNHQALLLGVRLKVDTYTSNMNMLANTNAANLRLYWATQWRLIMINSTTVAGRWSMTQSAGTWTTLLMAVDLSKTDKEAGLLCFQDGNLLAHASGEAFPSSGTTTFNSSNLWGASVGLFDQGNGGGTNWDGGVEWLWMDTYASASSMPDITDPAVIAEFSSDKFNSNGSTSVLPEPWWFFKDSVLTNWNSNTAGIANGSSRVATKFVRQGATSYT